MIWNAIIAGAAVGITARWPRARLATAVLLASACIVTWIDGPAPALGALDAILPLGVFLGAALSLAAMAADTGLLHRTAQILAWAAGGSAARLYAGVCIVTVALTLTLSLDAAVVLVAPVIVELARRWRASLPVLLLGAVGVANSASASVPQGNPTNLVLMTRLDVPESAFPAHLLPASLAAALASALTIAFLKRTTLRQRLPETPLPRRPLAGDERAVVAALGSAALAGVLGLAAGIGPVWPFAGVVVVALAARRARPAVPARLVLHLASLLVLVGPLARRVPIGKAGLVFGVLVAVSVFAALANNLPAGAAAASLPLAGHGALGAMLGLSVGALATPYGSVATLMATDMADPDGRIGVRAPLALAALVAVVTAGAVVELTF